MDLRFRQVTKADLVWCASILEDGFEQHPELKQKLPEIWETLLTEDAIVMPIVEDAECNMRRVAFGATGFVTDRFLQNAVSRPTPNLAVRILEREAFGHHRVLFRPDEIRKHSVGSGLNLVILHYSELVDGYSEDEQSIIRDTMVFGLLETHRRHNLKSLLYEFYGEQDLPYMLDSGINLVSDFNDWYRERNVCLPEPSRRPFLMAMTSEDARKRKACWMSWLFFSRHARLGLSPAEQKIVARALAGETDAQLAHHPEISPNTVRRHWRSIYKRFEVARIALIPPDKAEGRNGLVPSDEAVHKKKRPFALNYLRQHPEELRPQAAAAAVK